LIFFSSCDDELEGEDKCRFDFWVCDGWGGAMFGGLGVITETDNGADVRVNECSCQTLSPDLYNFVQSMIFTYITFEIDMYFFISLVINSI
jgi:hypothetical protein